MFCTRCGAQDIEYFCPNCGFKARKRLTFEPYNGSNEEKTIIEHYFRQRFKYSTILYMLEKYHGITMSMRTLKRRLQENNLNRRFIGNEGILKSIMVDEIWHNSKRSRGYRGWWTHLHTSYAIQVSRDLVMQVLKETDPVGTQERKMRRLKRRAYYSPGTLFFRFVFAYNNKPWRPLKFKRTFFVL